MFHLARRLKCSFCGKPEKEVKKLVGGPRVMIAGPHVYICDACIQLCNQILDHEGAPTRA